MNDQLDLSQLTKEQLDFLAAQGAIPQAYNADIPNYQSNYTAPQQSFNNSTPVAMNQFVRGGFYPPDQPVLQEQSTGFPQALQNDPIGYFRSPSPSKIPESSKSPSPGQNIDDLVNKRIKELYGSPGDNAKQNPLSGFNPMAGYNIAKQGIDLQTKAAQDSGLYAQQQAFEKSGVEEDLANKAQDFQDQQQTQFNNIRGELDDFHKKYTGIIDEINNSKIDPERYFKNQTTGTKIRMGIAIALASIGDGASAFAGRPADHAKNVLNIIDQNVKRDIESQIFDYNKTKDKAALTHNLFSMNMQKFNNELVAARLTHAQELEIAQHQLNSMSSEYQGMNQQNMTNNVVGQLKEQQGALLNQGMMMQLHGLGLMAKAQGKTKEASEQETAKVTAMNQALNGIQDLRDIKGETIPGLSSGLVSGVTPWTTQGNILSMNAERIAPLVAAAYRAGGRSGTLTDADYIKRQLNHPGMSTKDYLEFLNKIENDIRSMGSNWVQSEKSVGRNTGNLNVRPGAKLQP